MDDSPRTKQMTITTAEVADGAGELFIGTDPEGQQRL